MGFLDGSVGKESTYNLGDTGDTGSIPPWRRKMAAHSSILPEKIPMNRGAWWATVHRIAESDTTDQLCKRLQVGP